MVMSVERQGEDYSSSSAPVTGRLIDHKTRTASKMGGSGNCVGVNLSETGVALLGIGTRDEVSLVIYENGIWIPKND